VISTFVLVHGAFANSAAWAPTVAELTLPGHRALAVDLPGHGLGATIPTGYQPGPPLALIVAWARRPRPGPEGLTAAAVVSWCGHRSRQPGAWVGGWVGRTTESCGCAGARPRFGGTPVVDEAVSAGCVGNDPVVRFPRSGQR
jgi:Alpha/beta hydrolase family